MPALPLGRFNVCRNIGCIGCYSDGALVELLSVPVDKLCPVPEGLALEIAAMAEPASIAMQAVNRGRPAAGETALVLGSGPIGLLATLYLTDLGVNVVCADTEADRLELATAFGAADTLLVDPAAGFPDAEQAARLDAADRRLRPQPGHRGHRCALLAGERHPPGGQRRPHRPGGHLGAQRPPFP